MPFEKKELKARGEHIQKYLATLFLRDYVVFTKNVNSGRHDHSKFEELVKQVLNDKLADAKVEEALKAQAKADEETKNADEAEKAKKAKEASIFFRMLG